MENKGYHEGQGLWIVMPRFSAPLLEVAHEAAQGYLRAGAALTGWVFAGNQFWIFPDEKEARQAARTLKEEGGPCVTEVHVGPCSVSRQPPEEFDGLTYDGHYVRWSSS